jgi:ABC-2 type transport system permease protein
MPIHDQSYRRYGGERESVQSAWTVMALHGIRGLLRRRSFWVLLLLGWALFFVRGVQMYVAATFPQASAIAPGPSTYRDFLEQQSFFVFLITIYVGSGLIAGDRQANALQLYLSKPLSRLDYVAGKMAILLPFLLLVTWVPALLLLLLQAMFAGSFAFVASHLYLVPSITLVAWLQSIVSAFAMLALSSLSRNRRFVGVLYAGLVFFSDAVFGALRLITGGTLFAWTSVPASIEQLGDALFLLPLRYETPLVVSLVVVVGVIALSISVLERRIRGVEVVT